ncbi:MAG TPA: hypothetical protein VN213_13635 [Solirubrobacteraceae bacterium]|nr:hypothetical protein [Solirubrobacteraceae bacterium]HYC76222.1 hypothetical protein [Planctomycetota bacterium]
MPARDTAVFIRVTPGEKNQIQLAAAAHRVSISEYIRQQALVEAPENALPTRQRLECLQCGRKGYEYVKLTAEGEADPGLVDWIRNHTASVICPACQRAGVETRSTTTVSSSP